jgi:dephospho-CoA kinase
VFLVAILPIPTVLAVPPILPMLRVALTGGAATGKSYVLEQFRRRGVPCLVADELAHGVTAAGTEATAAIATRFGPEVIAPDGSVNRDVLGPIVFADAAARKDLESIVHPAVYRAIEAGMRAFEKLGGAAVTVVEIPLLYETGHASDFDRVIVTACADETQLERLRERGLSEEQARQIVSAQKPTAEKVALADFVIHTGGTPTETDAQVQRILGALG